MTDKMNGAATAATEVATQNCDVKKRVPHPEETFEEVPIIKAVFAYINFAICIFWGYINDWLRLAGLKNDCSLKGDVSDL